MRPLKLRHLLLALPLLTGLTACDLIGQLPGDGGDDPEPSPREALLDSLATVYAENFLAYRPLPVITTRVDDFGEKDAYAFQDDYVAELVERGGRVTGWKLGFTRQPPLPLGATEPIYGRLFESFEIEAGSTVSIGEAFGGTANVGLELALFIGEDLDPAMTDEELLDAVAYVAPALEIPDFDFASGDFNVFDLIAANAVSRVLILGERTALDGLDVDIDRIPVTSRLDGEVVLESQTGDALNGQASTLRFLVEELEQNGDGARVRAGDVVVTGALGGDTPLMAGTYEADFGVLGTVTATFTE